MSYATLHYTSWEAGPGPIALHGKQDQAIAKEFTKYI